MCRLTGYLGPEICLHDLLSKPDNALVHQFSPQLHALLNLAGFGMMAWDDRDAEPLTYRSTTVPIYDTNLDSLSRKVHGSTLVAHVRGIPYQPSLGYGPQNLHPFHFPGAAIALAHNGDLVHFADMRLALLRQIRPEIAVHIRGTTDSEYVYATLLSQLDDPSRLPDNDELLRALSATIEVLMEVRAESGIDTRSSLNLAIFAQDFLAGARLTLNFGHYDLEAATPADIAAPYLGMWYTVGSAFRQDGDTWRMTGDAEDQGAVLISSEPLTRDTTGWVEVPEYGVLIARRAAGRIGCTVRELMW